MRSFLLRLYKSHIRLIDIQWVVTLINYNLKCYKIQIIQSALLDSQSSTAFYLHEMIFNGPVQPNLSLSCPKILQTISVNTLPLKCFNCFFSSFLKIFNQTPTLDLKFHIWKVGKNTENKNRFEGSRNSAKNIWPKLKMYNAAERELWEHSIIEHCVIIIIM